LSSVGGCVDRFERRYSQRRATSGSTFVARLAGGDAAMNATKTNRTVAPMNVDREQSVDGTP
jgi:hypothetical protein